MFGMGSARVRAGLVATALVAAAVLAVVVVQASASGAKASKLAAVAKPTSLKQAAAAVQESIRSQGGPRASAIVNASPATVSCGQTLTASTTLTANLVCEGQNGLQLGASGIVLNLDGHYILGAVDTEDDTLAVSDPSAKDTIENGYIEGFEKGVDVTGTTDTVTSLQVTYTRTFGLVLEGSADKATSDIAAENYSEGMYVTGTGDTLQSDHQLNNEGDGLTVEGSGAKVLDNVANGNAFTGIFAAAGPATLTGNVANYNGMLGIDAISPQIDGGSNTAEGNGTKEQCRGVVCS